MNIIDLQIQSTASDGKHTPEEIVVMAAAQGLRVIALTDHDTTDGVDEAVRAGEEKGIRVIPGIEISVEERGVHILGYGIDHKNSALLEALEKARVSRISGAQKMVENLRGAGFVVEWDDVVREQKGPTVARPHIARAILNRHENKEKLGGASTVHEFIEKFLSDESPYYVRRAHVSAHDAIGLIHGARGVAIWSHPAVHFRKLLSSPTSEVSEPDGVDYETLEQFLKELIKWGIDGLEVFNPSHTEDDMEFLIGCAAEHQLLITAGSDFHELGGGAARQTQGLHAAGVVGDYETHGYSMGDIIERLDEALSKKRMPAVSPAA